MIEYWKFFNDYKFYSDDWKLLSELKKIKGAKVHSIYFKNQVKVAEDIIIPKNRFEFTKNLCKKYSVVL